MANGTRIGVLLLLLIVPAAAQDAGGSPDPDAEALREELRAVVQPQTEAELDLWFEYALATFIIPPDPPAEGVEWGQLLINRDTAWGETNWTIAIDSESVLATATLSIPSVDLEMVLTLAETPAVAFFGDRYRLRAEIFEPWQDTVHRGSYNVNAGSRLVLGSQQIAYATAASPGNFEADLTTAGLRKLLESETLQLTVFYEDWHEVTAVIALGETGHAVLEEAFRLWESPPFDLTNVVPGLTVLPGAGHGAAYLYAMAPGADAATRDAGRAVWSKSDYCGGPGVRADIVLPRSAVPVFLMVCRGDDAIWVSVESDYPIADQLPTFHLRLKPERDVTGEPYSAPEVSVGGNLSFAIVIGQLELTNFHRFVEWDWFEVELVYPDGRFELLVFEKGETGRAVFAEALASWGLATE